MFILPFQETLDSNQKLEGLSISAIPKSILVLSGVFGCLAISTSYHSALYGYSIPDWSIPLTICSLAPFGFRVRLLVSSDKKTALKQWALFGVKIRELVFSDEGFSTFTFEQTGCMDSQRYWVLKGESKRVSLHISKISSKEIGYLTAKISSFLGVKK